MSDKVYVVPGAFEFAGDESKPKHVVIVWARSQTEVAHTAEGARARVERMSAWVRDGRPLIVREFEESAAGEIGTYVTNRADGGVVAEIVFRSK